MHRFSLNNLEGGVLLLALILFLGGAGGPGLVKELKSLFPIKDAAQAKPFSQGSPTPAPAASGKPGAGSAPIVAPPAGQPAQTTRPTAIQIGVLAPQFSLQTLAGETVHLSDFSGKAVILNFWASWCLPCRREMPHLQKTYDQLKDQGLVVLGIDDTAQDSLPDVQAFSADLKLTFPILLDKTGEVVQLYNVLGLPTSIFIGRDGIIQWIQVGEMSAEQVSQFTATFFSLEASPTARPLK